MSDKEKEMLGLIAVLLDSTARIDERHDAAMDIGAYPDKRVLEALIRVTQDPNEDDLILDACGESIAEILVAMNNFNRELLLELPWAAFDTARAYIEVNKPEWELE